MKHSDSSSDNLPLIWVLCGGTSTEHGVSLVSGRQIAAALGSGGYRVRPVVIARDGGWRVHSRTFGPGAEAAEIQAAIQGISLDGAEAIECDEALGALRRDKPACVFIALHGPGGEDGALQGMLDWAGARYTCSGPAASALAMDKIRAQAFFACLGFRIPYSVSTLDLDPDDRLDPDRHAARLACLAKERLSLPVFVKPSFGGSSLGMTRVEWPAHMEPAVKQALETSSEVLVEQEIAGRELTCGVLEMRGDDGGFRARALPVTEIRPVKAEYFDYEAKYTPGACEEITPAPIDERTTLQVRDAALRAHSSLGCRGMSRADFILGDDGELYILEINTIPGMTPTSLLPQGAARIGLSYADLCDCLIQSAICPPVGRISRQSCDALMETAGNHAPEPQRGSIP